ncbi:hypothetical protein [Anaerovibrio sp. RM50]|uniref:hypothetical protein n=1 Tax=Anaerovibrio sp. RM50 TaxID=1200557 RepID=UPI0012EB1E4C|nr:hypothetical protein [Anaerovibrio sp. RM50]
MMKELSKHEINVLTQKMCHTTDMKELEVLAEKLGMNWTEESLKKIQAANQQIMPIRPSK